MRSTLMAFIACLTASAQGIQDAEKDANPNIQKKNGYYRFENRTYYGKNGPRCMDHVACNGLNCTRVFVPYKPGDPQYILDHNDND